MTNGFSKVFLAVLSLLSATTIQLKLIAGLGWSFDFFLLAIIVPAFFLDTSEFIFFGAFAALLSKLIYPLSFGEAAALAVFPIIIFTLKKVLIWQSWFEPFLATIVGILGFYLLIQAPLLSNGFGFLLMDLAASFIFAWGLYALFGGLKRHGR